MSQRLRHILAAVLVLASASTAVADWWISTPSGYQNMGGAARLGPYPSRAAAENVNASYFQGNGTVSGSDSASSGAAPTLTPDQNLMIQGARMVGSTVGNEIGQAISQALFGNPQADANEAQALNNQGIQYYNQGNWQAAAQCFREALAKAPNDNTIWQNLIKANTQLQALMAQAEKARQEAIARQKQETYDRLASQMQLSDGLNAGLSLPQTATGGGGNGLSLKDVRLGDDSGSDRGNIGIRGLPGIALNDKTGNGGETPYGIPGLPGIYVNGPGPGSGLTQPADTQLRVRLGDDTSAPEPAANTPAPAGNDSSGIQNTPPAGGAQGAEVAKSPESSPSAPAAVANTPEGTPTGPEGATPTSSALAGPAGASLQGQTTAGQAAVNAATPEDASAKAQAGFDSALPSGGAPAVVVNSNTPANIPPPASAASRSPAAATTAASSQPNPTPISMPTGVGPAIPKPAASPTYMPAGSVHATDFARPNVTTPAPTTNGTPTRQALLALIKHLDEEIHGLQNVLRGLDRTETMNQEERTAWVEELNQATARAETHLGNMIIGYYLERIGDRLEERAVIKERTIAYDEKLLSEAGTAGSADLQNSLRADQQELAQIKSAQSRVETAKTSAEALEVTDIVTGEGDPREKTLELIHKTVEKALDNPEVRAVLNVSKTYSEAFKYSKDAVDSTYDLADVCASAKQLALQNNASLEYLQTVGRIKTRMESVVGELNQAKAALASMPPGQP